MSETSNETHTAGEGVSDREMVEAVAEQTDSASVNAQHAGKDWDGDPSEAPDPTE
ncbi:hypothetical protein [Klenkia sp. PcliD-1-E]|uniref:hypothetical protein n=1 Tax=Klenkia sp. PcliD-1-E TaxID=2954492 RepID=UPI0020975D34|nr:hypothetical protein [Klenkia sp. PcliD-1-E]MCO7220697.1 hypothetical protein [Klenkia sp. PcliD-1-E]